MFIPPIKEHFMGPHFRRDNITVGKLRAALSGYRDSDRLCFASGLLHFNGVHQKDGDLADIRFHDVPLEQEDGSILFGPPEHARLND